MQGTPPLSWLALPKGGELQAQLLFCFPSTWKRNKTGLMKNTHGKCCIIPSSSPTALWHPSVISEDFPLREQPSLGWYEAATLPFPVNFLLPPPPPSLSPQHQQRPHSPPLSCDSFKSGEQGALDTGGHQPQSTSNLDR